MTDVEKFIEETNFPITLNLTQSEVESLEALLKENEEKPHVEDIREKLVEEVTPQSHRVRAGILDFLEYRTREQKYPRTEVIIDRINGLSGLVRHELRNLLEEEKIQRKKANMHGKPTHKWWVPEEKQD